MPAPYSRTTITAALPYVNGPVHLGSLAGAYLPADIYARYLRMKGEKVAFICGSDEHGVAILLKAAQEGLSPREVIDKYHALVKKSFEDFGISFDHYGRTSDPVHHQMAQEFFLNLHGKGLLNRHVSQQYYDPLHKQFLPDRYVIGTCPVCGNDRAYGDQCERCGSTLSPEQLINPHSALSGATPELRETEHWYLPLQDYQTWLEDWLLKNHGDWKPNVIGQCRSWLAQGLQERSITRDMDWGVKVPLPDAEGKVLYVWFDAPIGYISATKAWADSVGENWEDWWKAPDTRLVHFLGKDNIVFHCIIFPAMLHAHGEYVLPDAVPANEFLNIEGVKISTSRNWAVWLNEYLEDLPGKQDVLRYVLTSILPETKDSDFSWKDFQARNNNELVAILGNFVNRVITFSHRFFHGKVQPVIGTPGAAEEDLLRILGETPGAVSASLESYRFREALSILMDLARAGNKYLTDTEPWKLVKTDMERAGTVLHFGLQIAANLSILMVPFLPTSASQLQKALLGERVVDWSAIGKADLLEAGASIGELGILFEKIDDELIGTQIEKLHSKRAKPIVTESEETVEPSTLPALLPEITYDDFARLDIRMATVLKAEKVKGADKLLKIDIDLGFEQRTIVSGIAEHYRPEDLPGRQVCIVANLTPRKLRGITSQGMVLMIEDADGRLVFLQGRESVSNGTRVS